MGSVSTTWYKDGRASMRQNHVAMELKQLWSLGALPPTNTFTGSKALFRNVDDTFTRDRELRIAIRLRDVALVRKLIAEGVSLTHRVRGYNPLHSCVNLYSSRTNERGTSTIKTKEDEIVHVILTAAAQSNKSDILDSLDAFGRTPLCIAIERGDLKTVDSLVSAGANVEHVRGKSDSALHISARNCHRSDCSILKYLLDNCDIKNAVDVNGNAPIHYAIDSGVLDAVKMVVEKFGHSQLAWHKKDGSTAWHGIAAKNAVDIAQYLLQVKYRDHRALLNVVDNEGNTPVYKSVENGHLVMTALLLRNGASLSVAGEKENAVKRLVTSCANPISFFEDVFDDCINEKDNFLKVDYEVLTDDAGLTQINVMEELVKCGQGKLLKHPMMESLIYLKWKCMLPLFYAIIATYAVFLIVFNVFVITTFNYIDTNNKTRHSTIDVPSSDSFRQYWILVALTYLSIGVCVSQEAIWISLQKLRYFVYKESWLKLSVLALATAVPVSVALTPGSSWQRHLACAALLLGWLQAMLLLSRFPRWGYYVLMFERVAINILKILVTSICLIVGFSICFMIQYQSRPPFDGPISSFMKTLVMMSSEFDYERLFDETNDLEKTKEVISLLFVLFVIFIAIVLMNFMIGVAVSDINELNVIGNCRRLEKQVQLLSILEGLTNTVLARWWKRLSRVRYYRAISRPLVMTGRKWIVLPQSYYVYPADLLEMYTLQAGEFLTSTLQRSIDSIARKKRQDVNKLDAVYDAIVGPQHPKHDDDVTDVSATLIDKIKSIEDCNKEMIEANKEMKKSIDDLKINVDKILESVVGMIKHSIGTSESRTSELANMENLLGDDFSG